VFSICLFTLGEDLPEFKGDYCFSGGGSGGPLLQVEGGRGGRIKKGFCLMKGVVRNGDNLASRECW